MIVRTLVFFGCLLVSPLAAAADWEPLQAAALSFMDVGTMAEKTMALCDKAELGNDERARLAAAYRHFREIHLPQKAAVNAYVIESARQLGPDGPQFLARFQDPAVRKELAEWFPTKRVSRDYCVVLLTKMLDGQYLALNFNDYAIRIREEGMLGSSPGKVD
ncbi:hypothetical protein G4G28_13285 [Massilia sp. Dwa41.01b]|uniref:hypothetical protein n=1 Tax=unclassified Massilia TaxID=2609279 RepID=UPI001600270D|nr:MULTISPECIES: hypothetical protein [unclassified Massilia]QNA89194.1 hypothetical protein G4G28_13285 [Massilia sp. Dwa41.01b]QNB00095.1 hypothetical protein G4G31_16835 [Massilia sp. Se16.2.3]